MVKVSFIVPVYNVEKYIAQCVESLCNQAEKSVEIILVDDGSTDESLKICREYEKRDGRIKVIHQANQGANIARNKGLMEATGKWVCFVDGDDWVENNICTGLKKYLEQSYDIIFYSYNKVYKGKKKRVESTKDIIEFEERDFFELQIATFNRLGPYKYNVKELDTVSVWNKMYRREFLMEHNLLFVPEMPKLQDLTFNLKVYDYAKCGVYLNIATYNYRINEESVSNRYQPDIARKFEVIHGYLNTFVEKHEKEIYKQLFYERVATHLRTCIVLCYCNCKNKKGYMERKRDFFHLLKQEPYATAMKEVDVKHFLVKESILSWAIKHKCFGMCEMLYKANFFMEKIKS